MSKPLDDRLVTRIEPGDINVQVNEPVEDDEGNIIGYKTIIVVNISLIGEDDKTLLAVRTETKILELPEKIAWADFVMKAFSDLQNWVVEWQTKYVGEGL